MDTIQMLLNKLVVLIISFLLLLPQVVLAQQTDTSATSVNATVADSTVAIAADSAIAASADSVLQADSVAIAS